MTANTNIVVLTAIANTTSAANMLTEFDSLVLADTDLTDDDDILVLWYDGADSYLSEVNMKVTSAALDDGTQTGTALVKFVGVDLTAAGAIVSANLDFY